MKPTVKPSKVKSSKVHRKVVNTARKLIIMASVKRDGTLEIKKLPLSEFSSMRRSFTLSPERKCFSNQARDRRKAMRG
jgi:hypothetical protein